MEVADTRADDFKLYLDLQSEDPATWVQVINGNSYPSEFFSYFVF